MSAPVKKTEGWYGPPRSRRWHYFKPGNGGRSLCGKWLVLVADEAIPFDVSYGPADGDCAACRRVLDKDAA